MVRYWDDIGRELITRFLAMPVSYSGTAEVLLGLLVNELQSQYIP